jgi:hypothetical protein
VYIGSLKTLKLKRDVAEFVGKKKQLGLLQFIKSLQKIIHKNTPHVHMFGKILKGIN